MLRPWMAVMLLGGMSFSSVSEAAQYKPGEVIVKYKGGVVRTRSTMNALYDHVGMKSVFRFGGIMKGYEQLILDESSDVSRAIALLREDPQVEYAQPNYYLYALPVTRAEQEAARPFVDHVVRPFEPCWIPGIPLPPGCDDSETPTPPGFPPGGGGSRPGLKAPPTELTPPVADPDLEKSYGIAKIGATEAWKVTRGDAAFLVADIDTGIDYNHDDLGLNVWRNPRPSDKNDVVGFDFVHNDGLPFDDNQHGTHTAGTIGAVGGNGVGTSGVIQRVSLMSLKFLSAAGQGTTSDAVKAIDYAVDHGAKVLSNSWGGPAESDNNILKDAVERARAKDVLFIAAAGNDGKDNDVTPSYPAAFDNDNMIAVAATDSSDGMAYFSNYGVKTTHLGAPGVSVYSTIPGGKYGSLSGTSMACPHVAGAAALIWSKHPKWTYKQVKEVLLKSVDKLPSLEGKTITGGRLNVLKAMQLATTEE